MTMPLLRSLSISSSSLLQCVSEVLYGLMDIGGCSPVSMSIFIKCVNPIWELSAAKIEPYSLIISCKAFANVGGTSYKAANSSLSVSSNG